MDHVCSKKKHNKVLASDYTFKTCKTCRKHDHLSKQWKAATETEKHSRDKNEYPLPHPAPCPPSEHHQFGSNRAHAQEPASTSAARMAFGDRSRAGGVPYESDESNGVSHSRVHGQATDSL